MRHLALPLIIWILGVSVVQAQETCPRFVAPSYFLNAPKQWGNDSGPIVKGFIDSRSPNGSILKAMQGVDLSRYNRIDYSRLVQCGGTFSIVQMDDQFLSHFDKLNKVSVLAIPYFFFKLPLTYRMAKDFPEDPDESEIGRFREKYAKAGEDSARLFLSAVQKFKQDNKVDVFKPVYFGGLTGRFVALDVEQKAVGRFSRLQGVNYGKFYATAVCSWIQTVLLNPGTSDVIPILYTTPSVYGEYLTYAFPEENRCLQKFPVWVARTYANGGEALHDTRAKETIDKYVQRMCNVQGGNRCIIHQYTHRGVFMSMNPIARRGHIPEHFDLDRFYQATLIENATGIRYIRIEDPFF